MTTMRRDRLVDDYLRRLEAAAAGLPPERRSELVDEIREHVDAALAEAGTDDEAAVRNVLERLGSPEEIAAAAGPPAAPERGRLELAALIVLSVSFILPVVGYLICARLVLASRVWDGRDKFLALIIPPVVVLGGAVVVMIGSASIADGDTFDSGLGPVEIAVLLANVFSGLAAAAYLSARLRRTAAR
jgi:uncharacterized membrane protein